MKKKSIESHYNVIIIHLMRIRMRLLLLLAYNNICIKTLAAQKTQLKVPTSCISMFAMFLMLTHSICCFLIIFYVSYFVYGNLIHGKGSC